MRRLMAIGLGLAAMLIAWHAAAQIVFYDQEGLRGRSFAASSPIYSFDEVGFNDRASSVVVERGEWEVCEDAYFRGKCLTLRPGQYPSLASFGMNRKISSVRPLSGRAQYGYAPPPPAMPVYSYYPHSGETLYTANVLAVRAVVGPPQQRCWVEQQQVVRENQPNIAGAVIGGVLGGVLGHQIGSGRGNDVATAVGAVGGAALGANVNRGTQTSTQNVQRCEAVPGSAQPAYWDVTYEFRGVTHRAQLSFAPGATITVNWKGEPRV
ncbi:MAG TPA: beta/gamma crystallin-related protein [Casimicrobiaceae bacterium]|nr:beta/gamma crystallin-related protein [Casimicrobiaceae bacterium]